MRTAKILKVFMIALSVFFATVLNQTLFQMGTLESVQAKRLPNRQKLNPELFRTLTFGFLPLTIDWIFIRMIADGEKEKVSAGQHPDFYYDLDLATDLDPAFFELYQTGGYLLSLVRGDHEGAKDVLRKGIAFYRDSLRTDPLTYTEIFKEQYWGQAWNLSVILAYIYLFQFDDMPHAAASFREAATLPGAPAYLASLEKKLGNPGGEYEVGIRLLRFLISGAPSEKAKEALEKKPEVEK